MEVVLHKKIMKNYKKYFHALAFTIALFTFWSCDENSNSNSTKPKARGAIGEIVLAIDSLKWQGPVGDALREVFEEDVAGLIREESRFDIRKVDPRGMPRVLKMSSNIIFVTTFDDRRSASQSINSQFTKDSKEKAAADPNLYLLRNVDEFAVGQEVLYLFGRNEEELIANLRKNKTKLQNLFQTKERERLSRALMSRKNSAAAFEARNFGLEISVPASYQIAKSADNFLWLRQPTPSTSRPDISIFFYETNYTSEDQILPEEIIKLRTEISKKHIFGNPDNPNSFLVVEDIEPEPVFTNSRINDKFAVEIRGGWKTYNMSMGGSFLAYVVLDPEKGKLYYMEGFVYYPNEAHREPIREIETILQATEVLAKQQSAGS
jgi:hypothetical protein